MLYIFGSVGCKQVILSCYCIDSVEWCQLLLCDGGLFDCLFGLCLVILVSYLLIDGGGELVVFNVCFDCLQVNDDIFECQVEIICMLFDELQVRCMFWLFGGDFNLLLFGQYFYLLVLLCVFYWEDSELVVLSGCFLMVLLLEEVSGVDQVCWYMYFFNDLWVQGLDWIFDYLFYSFLLICFDVWVWCSDMLQIFNYLLFVVCFLLFY